jgi:excisionase family DNA binding protein
MPRGAPERRTADDPWDEREDPARPGRPGPCRHKEISAPECERLVEAAARAEEGAVLDLAALPESVRAQVLFALDSLAHGHQVAAVATGKPLTTSEAAELLGMSRTYLTRLCDEGRIPSYTVGTSRRIEAETVMTILRERSRARDEARAAASTRDERRPRRAAQGRGPGVNGLSALE